MAISEEVITKSIQATKIKLEIEEQDRMIEEARHLEQWLEPLLQVSTNHGGSVHKSVQADQADKVLREDKVREVVDKDKLTGNSDNFQEGFYRVPSVIEE